MFAGRDILLLVAIGITLPFCLVRPVWGVLIWTMLGFLNPQAFTWGYARTAPLAEAVAILTLVAFLFRPRLKRLLCTEMVLLGVLWGWFTLTTLSSLSTPILAEKAPDAWYRWGLVSKILLMTVVSVGIINSRARFRWLLLTIGGSFGLLVLHTLPGMIVFGGGYRIYGPPNSMVADNNAFGLATNMALPFFFYLAKTESDRRLKWFFGMAFLAGIPVVFFTYSRGALLGLAVMSFCMLLQSRQKILLVPMALLAILFALFLTPQAWRNRMGNFADGSLDNSARSRINSWHYCWNLAQDYPIIGGGFEAFTPELFSRYAPNPRDVHGPHSIYFQLLLEHGFMGFFIYYSLVVYCFISLRRIVKWARLHGDEVSADYASMLRFSLIAFLTSGAFLGVAYFDFYFTIVACTAILSHVCREEWAANAKSEENLAGSEEPFDALPSPAGV